MSDAVILRAENGRQIELTMPHMMEAEAIVLGAMICDNGMIDRVRDIVRSDDFWTPVHQSIFQGICAVHDKGQTVNPITLRPVLDGDPALKAIGGSNYLVSITTTSVSVIGALDIARQVKEMGQRRELVTACAETIERATSLNAEASAASIMEDADGALTGILNRELSESAGVRQVTAKQAFDEMMADMEGPQRGVVCQDIEALDNIMGPIRPHHLVIAAGRPGMGKTALALCYSLGVAKQGNGVLFVSLEMSRIELMQRATAAILYDGNRGVPYHLIRDGNLKQDDQRAVFHAGRMFADIPLNIVDAGSLTIGRLNAIVRRWKRRMAARGQSLDLIVVDYLQLLRADGKTSGQYESVSEVSRGLKALAKTHDVGIMALAQLSREVEKRTDKRPMLSDLRDSGQIEQDADAVLFLYREEYYLRQAMTVPNSDAYIKASEALEYVKDEIDFIVAKRRNGETGSAKGIFKGAFQAVLS
jgi:replicative DNA helicase